MATTAQLENMIADKSKQIAKLQAEIAKYEKLVPGMEKAITALAAAAKKADSKSKKGAEDAVKKAQLELKETRVKLENLSRSLAPAGEAIGILQSRLRGSHAWREERIEFLRWMEKEQAKLEDLVDKTRGAAEDAGEASQNAETAASGGDVDSAIRAAAEARKQAELAERLSAQAAALHGSWVPRWTRARNLNIKEFHILKEDAEEYADLNGRVVPLFGLCDGLKRSAERHAANAAKFAQQARSFAESGGATLESYNLILAQGLEAVGDAIELIDRELGMKLGLVIAGRGVRFNEERDTYLKTPSPAVKGRGEKIVEQSEGGMSNIMERIEKAARNGKLAGEKAVKRIPASHKGELGAQLNQIDTALKQLNIRLRGARQSYEAALRALAEFKAVLAAPVGSPGASSSSS